MTIKSVIEFFKEHGKMTIKSVIEFFKEHGKMNIKSVIEFFREYCDLLLVLTIPTAMIISILIMAHSSEPDPKYNTTVDNSNITVHTIDNHEYLVYHYNNAGGMCHKVDCKFCMTKSGKDTNVSTTK